MKRAGALMLLVLLAGCSFAPAIPPIDYPAPGVLGVMQWVAENVRYRPEGVDGSPLPDPETTFREGSGNCTGQAVLALYLVYRDLGLEGELVFGERIDSAGQWLGHAWPRIAGVDYDPQIGAVADVSLYTVESVVPFRRVLSFLSAHSVP